MDIQQNTVIVIAGPTAVGKTSLSIELAKRFNTAIISADSRQCFKELNIGVAKPSEAQLASVKHYFIGSHSIQEEVNAGVYEQYALASVEEIFKHSSTAIMVGGTGLYINAFCNGIDEMPPVNEGIRKEIVEQYQLQGLPWLQDQIMEKDPAFWQIAEQQNPQRLMRALEFVLSTGTSITQFWKGGKVERPFKIVKVALELPRELLIANINKRVDEMMEAGLVEEVSSLLPYKLLNALQTVGYDELFSYFDQQCTLAYAIDRIKIHTRQYAKRQMTMFQKQAFNWIDLKGKSMDKVVEEVLLCAES